MSGVLGIYNVESASRALYYGLHTLQHRGQEGAGIVSSDGKNLLTYKRTGMVRSIFKENILQTLVGDMAIGHVHYPTKETLNPQNIQPLTFHRSQDAFSCCLHGDVINALQIREYLEDKGSIFQTDSDVEVFSQLLALNQKKSFEKNLTHCLNQMEGSFGMLYVSETKMVAVRDRYGLSPLVLGKLDDGYVISSESCAFNTLGATYIRDIKPGEVLIFENGSYKSLFYAKNTETHVSAMEYIYYSRPDSNIEGINVHIARKNTGKMLAKEAGVDADIVIGVPDSALSAAHGYAEQTGLPYEMGLIKNRYIGRTFIMPTQHLRKEGVLLKLSPVASVIEGKRIVLIDDSIVRGTTSVSIVKMLKDAGAKEIHLRIASPAIISSQFYGLDSYENNDLISKKYDKEALKDFIGVDSLEFLSVEGLQSAIGDVGLYMGCFNKVYPTHLYERVRNNE
ncbi:MAG: amidophosphoribosyltransferase [Erysipelothrix sp.]|nr:amidophosphoribosyltransferase [Erysipelothrix sp.]